MRRKYYLHDTLKLDNNIKSINEKLRDMHMCRYHWKVRRQP